jgi:RHS repeat-associated protein
LACLFLQGNTRILLSDENGDEKVDILTEIKQINHYYAFGLNMEGNWNGAAGANQYQYNGKEWQEDLDLGWNDYGARFYDPAMARWTTMDPLAELYVQWSPYNYVLNNPMNYIDPDGRNVFPPNDPDDTDSGSRCGCMPDGSTKTFKPDPQPQERKSNWDVPSPKILPVHSESYDDLQGNTTFTVSPSLMVFNFNSSSNSTEYDDWKTGESIAQKLKHHLYKRIMEDLTRPKLKKDDDENNILEFNAFVDEIKKLGYEEYIVEYNPYSNGVKAKKSSKGRVYISGVEAHLQKGADVSKLAKVSISGNAELGTRDIPIGIPNGASNAKFEIVRSHVGYIKGNGYTIFFQLNLMVK